MTCMVQRLPPAYVLKTKQEAGEILRDPNAPYSRKKLAWEFLKSEHESRKPKGDAA